MTIVDNTKPVGTPTLLSRSWRFARRYPNIAFGAVILIAILFISAIAPWISTHDPLDIDPLARLQPPSTAHLFGTDTHGRDLWSRVLFGGQASLSIGFAVAALSTFIGGGIGLASGYFRAIDGLVMRVMDAIMAIPAIMLAIALMALWQGSIQNVIIAITLAEIPRMARLVRGSVLSLREQLYVEAVISVGARSSRVILRHILPNAMAPIVVQATFVCASAMLIEAGMSFIGAGVPPTTPSWGNVLSEGRTLWQIRPEMVFIPAAALSLTVLAVNLLGDGLSDILDPRNKGRS